MAKVFDLYGKLSLNMANFKTNLQLAGSMTTGFARQWSYNLRGVSNELSRFGKNMALMGGTAFAGIGWGYKKMLDEYGALADQSAQLAMGAAPLSELGYAASQSGIQMETLVAGLGKMQKFMTGSDAGNRGLLRKMGLDPDELKKLSTADAFTGIIDALGKLSDQGQRMELSTAIFGRGSGAQFLRLAKDGAAGIAALRQQAREIGVSKNDDDVQRMDAAGDAMAALGANIGALKDSLLKDLEPAQSAVIKSLNRATIGLLDYKNQHQGASAVVTTAATGLAAFAAGTGVTFMAINQVVGGVKSSLEVYQTMTKWLGLAKAARELETVATVANTVATEANTAAKATNLAMGGGKLALGAVGAGTSALAIAGGAIGGGWLGSKFYDWGWADEGAGWGVGGAVFGGLGRIIGDRLGGRNPDRYLGEATLEKIRSGQINAGGGAESRGNVDGVNEKLMEEQNRLLREQNEHLRIISGNTSPGRNSSLSESPVGIY